MRSRHRVQGLIANAPRRVHGVTVLLEQVTHARRTKGLVLTTPTPGIAGETGSGDLAVTARTNVAHAGPVHSAERTWGRTAG
jgi:hypothetical protein